MGEGVSHSTCVEVRGQLMEVGSLLPLDPGDWTQVTRLGDKCLNPPSHLTCLWYKIFLCSPGFPGTHDFFTSVSSVLGLRVLAASLLIVGGSMLIFHWRVHNVWVSFGDSGRNWLMPRFASHWCYNMAIFDHSFGEFHAPVKRWSSWDWELARWLGACTLWTEYNSQHAHCVIDNSCM